MSLNLDTSFFSVICELKACRYFPEMDVEGLTLQTIIDDVKAGQFENVLAVLEYNPVEGWCRDVTSDVMLATQPDTCSEAAHETGTDWSDYRAEQLDARRAGLKSKYISTLHQAPLAAAS